MNGLLFKNNTRDTQTKQTCQLYTGQQKNFNWRVEHFLVQNTCPKSKTHNFSTRTCTVFTKNYFEIPNFIKISIFYNLLALKL